MEVTDFEIELGSDPSGGCPCCDPAACFPQGYVTRAGVPYAIYFADWDYGASGFVELMIAIGNWQEGSTPAERRAAAFRGRQSNGSLIWSALDANMSLWRDVSMVGQLLSAEDAAPAAEYRTLAEAIAKQDLRIQRALAETASTSTTKLRSQQRSGGDFIAVAPKERH